MAPDGSAPPRRKFNGSTAYADDPARLAPVDGMLPTIAELPQNWPRHDVLLSANSVP